MASPELYWLPEVPDWDERLRAVLTPSSWPKLIALANARLDFLATNRLDRVSQRLLRTTVPEGVPEKAVRCALLGSSMVDHLLPALRVAALRRGFKLATYTNAYGQYRQELFDSASALHAFKPEFVVFALDARHVLGLASSDPSSILAELSACWRKARQSLGCQVLQQTLLPLFPATLGNNEHRLTESLNALAARVNAGLRQAADAESVDLVAVEQNASFDGLPAWYDPALWYRAKQEIHPAAAPVYGDLVARLIAARQGRSFKCLVLDLDNALWGGVIGEVGVQGIVLGQGSPLGEAYLDFQRYARDLSRRGVILAVASKNEERHALAAFDSHPDMLLRRSDIACFAINWHDKAANLRWIAERLNIGLDAIVFADDNPFERNYVRHALSMTAVPELPEDPARFARCIADAGYFEGVRITSDDAIRTRQYQENAQRDALKESSADLDGFLEQLRMELNWAPVNTDSLSRVVQLINKTNQFNLTTRRYAEAQVAALIDDPGTIALQMRLVDRFGDNGIIAVVIGRIVEETDLAIDCWLMSCRVLGRRLEQATLNLIAELAAKRGLKRITGEYLVTPKNELVRDHYAKLGFSLMESRDDRSLWMLPLHRFGPLDTSIAVSENRP